MPPLPSDPGGGGGHAEEEPSPAPPPEAAPRQPPAGGCHADPGPPGHPCDVCGGPEQEHRLKVLFQVLDVNGDGGICVNDLEIGLKKLGVHRTQHELMVSGNICSSGPAAPVLSSNVSRHK